MRFSYNWLKELARFSDSPQELAELLTLRVFEVESVEKRGDDWALDVNILPNRVPDASGHIGLAREIAALKGKEFEVPYLKLAESKEKSAESVISVKITSKDDCPRYIARAVEGVKIEQSPLWLKKRLELCGLQSINNVVDAANFVMLETGQPLHVFDFDKIKNAEHTKPENRQSAKTIIVRRARKGEKMLALDDKTYELTPEILVIADETEPMAIAGIKGGAYSGVSAQTKNIILESANFNAALIHRGSRLLKLRTDASYRFEHGLAPDSAGAAIDRLAALISKFAGGTVLAGKADQYPAPEASRHVAFSAEHANRLSGVKFAPLLYETALKRLGFSYKKMGGGKYHVEIPAERRDIEREEDLIEEVARIWGYDKIPEERPATLLAPAGKNDERYWEERIKDFLAGAGFSEVFRYVFTGERELTAFGFGARNLIEVANPLTAEHQFLAAAPLTSYIRAAKENESHSASIRIFGIAKSFSKDGGSWIKGVNEKKRLVMVWSEKSGGKGELFFAMKGVIDEFFDALGLAEHWYDDAISTRVLVAGYSLFHPYRVAEIKIDAQKIGVIGELHPALRDELKSKHVIIAAEIEVEKLMTLAEKEAEFLPISKFPAVVRDIAVVVPEEEKTERILNVIENVGGKLLADSDLFDYFQDEAMRKGRKKSLAFHLIFQSAERTLKDEEVNRICRKIVGALKEKGWTVRE